MTITPTNVNGTATNVAADGTATANDSLAMLRAC